MLDQPIAQIKGLRVEFQTKDGPVVGVEDVSFDIHPGETVCIVGESGSGKSVSSLSLMRLVEYGGGKIAAGQLLFDRRNGEDVDLAQTGQDQMQQIRGDEIGMIFQEPMTSLNPVHTVGQQIAEMVIRHEKLSKSKARVRAIEMLELVGIPEPMIRVDSYPHEMSGGMRQRAMIAMALVCQPALLIADEPTTALDVTIQAQILKLLKDLSDELGMATLIITHDLGVVANLAEEVVVMYRGEIMESGSRDDLFRKAEHPYLKALFNAVPRFGLKKEERLKPLRDIKREDETGFATTAETLLSTKVADGKPLLKVENLQRQFHLRKNGWLGNQPDRTVTAVDGVSFDIKRGECLGLVGESGSGKTTLAKLIVRAVMPDEGAVTYIEDGVDIDVFALKGQALNKFRRKIQYIFQDPFSSLDPRMTVYDIVVEPLIIHNIGTDNDRRTIAAALMRLVGLDERGLRRYPHSFSGGQRQRIGIARALALKPDLLICDEPVSALDVGIQAQILNLLKDLQQELHLTYLFVSHNLAVVNYIADRIAVMCRGRLVEIAPREILFYQAVHPYTKGLIAAVPDINPDNPLDFDHLLDERASEPTAWPEPFREDGIHKLELQDLGQGHYVRASENIS